MTAETKPPFDPEAEARPEAASGFVPGCTGAFDPNEHGFCRCCDALDEWSCRCDEDTRDPRLPLSETR